MKMIFVIFLSCMMMISCAITHKRGADAQIAIDHYLRNRGKLPEELTKMVSLDNINEADVTIQWTVDDKGETQDISIEHDTLRNENVNTLLVEHLKSLRFPKSPKFSKATVEYTYKFQKSLKK